MSVEQNSTVSANVTDACTPKYVTFNSKVSIFVKGSNVSCASCDHLFKVHAPLERRQLVLPLCAVHSYTFEKPTTPLHTCAPSHTLYPCILLTIPPGDCPLPPLLCGWQGGVLWLVPSSTHCCCREVVEGTLHWVRRNLHTIVVWLAA